MTIALGTAHCVGDAPLLLAPLDDTRDGWPKFKGMEAGALKWLRER